MSASSVLSYPKRPQFQYSPTRVAQSAPRLANNLSSAGALSINKILSASRKSPEGFFDLMECHAMPPWYTNQTGSVFC